jgi:hypothetical protein
MEGERMTYTYQLKLAEGTDVDTVKKSESDRQVGDEVRAEGNVRYLITAVVPVERIAEFVDGATDGLLEVEPL